MQVEGQLLVQMLDRPLRLGVSGDHYRGFQAPTAVGKSESREVAVWGGLNLHSVFTGHT